MAGGRGFTLDQAHERSDPLLDFLWWCPDASLPFGLPSNFLESVDIPFNNIASNTVFSGSGYLCYPGTHSIDAFNMTLYEDSAARAVNYIKEWKSKVKNFSDGSYGLPIDYKRDMNVELLTTTGDVALRCKLIGIWPTTTSPFALNYTSSGRLVVTQTFAIDDISY